MLSASFSAQMTTLTTSWWVARLGPETIEHMMKTPLLAAALALPVYDSRLTQ
jgi:hypothetical protein